MKMTINNSDICDKIRSYVIRETFADKSKIDDNSLIFKEGYFDSMGFIKLITFLEEEFSITTTDADLTEENFESINAITYFVTRKTKD
jgi:acyl carrier protein